MLFSRFFLLITLVLTSLLVGNEESAATEPVRVVSLGDSFTAGNGAGRYHGRADCYRSRNNYVNKYVRSHTQLSHRNFACSNALTSDIPAQIKEAGSALKKADMVFLTIGGNDGEFAKIVVECVVAEALYAHHCVQRIEAIWQKLPDIAKRIRLALEQVRSASRNSQIVLVGYPYLMERCDYKVAIKDSRGLYYYNVSHQLRTIQAYMDGLTEKTVKQINDPKIEFVSILKVLENHMYCGDKAKWFVPLYGSKIVQEVFHPNKRGHKAIAEHLKQNVSPPTKIQPPILSKPSAPEPVSPNQPAPKSPPKTTAPKVSSGYRNMPFECNFATYGTTYDSFNYQGRTFYHSHAIDFPVRMNTKVVAPIDGVARVSWDPGGFGRFVDISNGSIIYRMAHLNTQVSVQSGQKVRRGQLVGTVGVTGATTGPHLHFEMLKHGKRVQVDLGGPVIDWGSRINASGDRRTVLKLVSGNCGEASGKATSPPAKSSIYSVFKDDEVKVSLQYRGRIYGVSEIGTHKLIYDKITIPKFRVECDRDSNGRDEIYSVEHRSGRHYIMQANIDGSGRPGWKQLYSTSHTIAGLSCGDFWSNNNDELKMHLSNGSIYQVNNSSIKLIFRGIQSPNYRVECDTDGNGRDEIISLEKTKHGYRLMQAIYLNGRPVWRHYIRESRLNGRQALGMSCGDSNGDRRDEVKVFFRDSRDIEMVNPSSSYWYRNFAPLFRHITPAKYMVECDMNGNGRDEIFYVETRGGRDYLMRGDSYRRAWHFVKRFNEPVRALSCGDMDGR